MQALRDFKLQNPTMTTDVWMDGDRYRLTIPDDSMKGALEKLLKKDEELFLDTNPETFPMKRSSSCTINCPFFRLGGKNPKSEYMAIWVREEDTESKVQFSDDVYPVRPMLVPVDANGKFDPTVIADADGTYVSGGTLYNADKMPLSHDIYGALTLTAGTSIGDTKFADRPWIILDWVVVQNRLVSRYALFFANGKTLLESGLVC